MNKQQKFDNVKYLIENLQLLEELEKKTQLLVTFININSSVIVDSSTFLKEFNDKLKPPKKFTNWDNFELQLLRPNWFDSKVLVSYSDSEEFKRNDPDGFAKSQDICNRLKELHGRKMSKLSHWFSAQDFAFNYNGSIVVKSLLMGLSAGAVTFGMLNTITNTWIEFKRREELENIIRRQLNV